MLAAGAFVFLATLAIASAGLDLILMISSLINKIKIIDEHSQLRRGQWGLWGQFRLSQQ
jgi:hypothetical protein